MIWFGHITRGYSYFVDKSMQSLALPRKRSRGKPKRRIVNVAKEDTCREQPKGNFYSVN